VFRALTFIGPFSQKAQIASAPKVIVDPFSCILFLLPAICAQAQNIAPPIPGMPPLSGIAIGNDGKPVQAVITAIKVGGPVAATRAEATSNGSFALTGIPDGNYQLCAVDKGANYLDPCAWSGSPVTVTISAAKPISNYQLVLTRGLPLQVRVNDTGQILAPIAGSNRVPAMLAVSVVTPRHTMQRLSLVSTDSGGRTLQSVVPANASILVKLVGMGLTLADVSGNALNVAIGASIPIQTLEAQQSLSFTVTGAVAQAGTTPQ
jgi:hypothetical protein